jgi:hypothetical protein
MEDATMILPHTMLPRRTMKILKPSSKKINPEQYRRAIFQNFDTSCCAEFAQKQLERYKDEISLGHWRDTQKMHWLLLRNNSILSL